MGNSLDLNDFYFFVQVVDHAGFSAAARVLDLPKSRLSRRISELESALQVRLLHRTSRRIALTDAGEAFYQHASAMLIEAEAAEHAVLTRLSEPAGTVRLACSIAIAQWVLAEILPDFLMRYPRLRIIQDASNRYVDPVGEGFDIVLRAHTEPLVDSSLIQKKLADVPWGLFAAPAYLYAHGEPAAPEDLGQHAALCLGSTAEVRWRLQAEGKSDVQVAVEPRPRYISNDMTSLRRAAVGGVGIVALPQYGCREAVAEGTLKRVLADWNVGQPQISLLLPSRRGQIPAVRALVELLSEEFHKRVA